MATMIAELYEALVKAGADDASARSAALAVADYERRATELSGGLVRLEGKIEAGFAELRAEMAGVETRITRWFIGVLMAQFAGIIAILVRLGSV
jgi:hypothetical protein